MLDFESENENQIKIKTICEFLFFDQYQDNATFLRFEQCFQPLFNNINISMERIFKDICGPKKKYITYRRFAWAVLKHMEGKDKSKDTETFFDLLFNSILKEENTFVGKNKEKVYSFSTIKTCKNRENISKLQILCDKERIIHGINLEYDGIYNNEMFPKSLEDELAISLEMKLTLLNEQEIKESIKDYPGIAKKEEYMDAITHIFGTIDKKSGFITFLGIKCISGKTVYVGFPKGDGFLFGKFGYKFHDIKIQMKKEGITKLFPYFNKQNIKANFFLNKISGKLLNQNLKEQEIIKDEETLVTLNDDEEIDKMITTPIVEDNYFFNKKLKDKISGNDYKEVVDQGMRNWIMKRNKSKQLENKVTKTSIIKIADALKRYNEEKEKTIQKSYNFITKKITKCPNNSKFGNLSFLPKLPQGRNNLLDPKISKKISFILEKIEENDSEEEEEENKLYLHKTKMLRNKPKFVKSPIISDNLQLKLSTDKWDGKSDANINTFFNKKNYVKLKEEFGKMVHDEILEKISNESNFNDPKFLNMFIPFPGKKSKKTIDDNIYIEDFEINPIINIKKLNNEITVLKKEDLKNQEVAEKSIQNEEENNEKTIIYSDASKFLNNLNDLDKNLNKKEGIKYTELYGIRRFRQFKSGFLNTLKQILNLYINNPKDDNENVKLKKAQKNWKYFRKTIEKINGIFFLQTIGTIVKVNKILKNLIKVPITEKIKLYKSIEEKEEIINLIQPNINNGKEINDFYELLIPDEHPENITDLNQLEKDIVTLKKFLEDKKINKEERDKVHKLYNLFLQQKNILIENETKNCKDELVLKNSINIDKYLQKEQEKRNKAQEDEKIKIDEEISKKRIEKEKSKKINIAKSFLIRKIETRIFLDQKKPKSLVKWKDDIFPPEKVSLCPYNGKGWVIPKYVLESDIEGWDKIEWSRAEEIDSFETHDVFVKGATIEDIQQGNIGDCYFFSVVGALCNYPDFFEKIFHTKEKSEEHVYGIYLYLNGKWKLVLVDDYFPIRDINFKQFYFSCSVDNELWVSLIEKAWAKVNGCYANIACGGLCGEVFDILTEAYTEHIEIINYDKEEIWEKMENAVKKNYVMTAGTMDENQNIDLDEVGLSYSHAYTVINIYNVDTKKGSERLIKLKNPWRSNEFNGEWSNFSRKWTPELKQQCDFQGDIDDGIFYMSFNDFIKYYALLDIAKLEKGYCSTYCKISKNKAIKCQVIQLIVDEESPNTFIQLYQKNPRIIRKNGTKFPSPAQSFIILINSDFKFIKSVHEKECHIGMNVDLKPGKYFIFCDVNYRNETVNNKTYGYTITFYSKKPLKNLENVTEKIEVRKILESSLYNYCKEKLKPKTHKSGMKIYQTENFSTELPFTLFCFENTTNKALKIKFDIINEKNTKTNHFCFYNDKIATEFDSSVIKVIEPGKFANIMIWVFLKKSKFAMMYEILNSNDKKTYENTHRVFNSPPQKLDKKGELFSHLLKIEKRNGFSIGLENVSDKELLLEFKLKGAYDIDEEYFEKENIDFKMLPKSKKVFNIRIRAGCKSIEFNFNKK